MICYLHCVHVILFMLHCIRSEDSLWSQVLDMKDSIDVDYSKLEEMFAQPEPASPKNSNTLPTEVDEKSKRNSHNHEVGGVTLVARLFLQHW